MRDFDKSFRWGSFTLFIEDFIADYDLLTPDIARELSMVDGDEALRMPMTFNMF